MSYLKIIAIGNLGQDPDLKYTRDGKPVCNLSIATSEKRKDRDGNMKETTTWIRVTFMGRQAETAAQYLKKGKPVYIEGRGKLSEWTDRDGQKRSTLEVFGTEMQFIGSREDNGEGGVREPGYQPSNRPSTRTAAAPAGLPVGDDVPF